MAEQYFIKYQYKAKDGMWETVEEIISCKGKGKHLQIEKWLKTKFKDINILSIKFC